MAAQTIGVKDASTKVTATVTKGARTRIPCMLCRRWFPSAAHLKRHEKHSDLHRSNMEKQDEVTYQRKAELKLAVHCLRSRIVEMDGDERALQSEEGQSHRTLMEMQLRQLLFEYGQAQETIEDGRPHRSSKKRRGPSATKGALQQEKQVGRLALMAGAASWQGNKDVQEDRYLLDLELESPEGTKIAGFLVLDGHSGSLCCDHLMERLPGNLQKCLSTKPGLSEETLSQAVTEACVLTDDEFLQRARQQEVLDGSTLILGIVYPEDSRPGSNGVRAPGSCRILIANVGDSRAVLCRATAQGEETHLHAFRLSEDHKPIVPTEQKRIEAKGGIVDLQGVWRVFTPGPANFAGKHIARWGLAVSRAFGDVLLKEPERYGCMGVLPGGLITAMPEIRVFDLEPAQDRFLILACDGVWDVLQDDDAVAVCSSQAGAQEAALALVRRSFAAASDDNLTALVLTWRDVD
ncbi:Probable protein phosphatase 2C 52 (OsPP2C52) [Durusdinium trenchii]|uniref:Probable protein phosphatase 2C 52 (OsPP2C52) n=1 Tax=Durusdinium trenchii TaxID=1381693 RepID=A0ABP0S2L1_9DINO